MFKTLEYNGKKFSKYLINKSGVIISKKTGKPMKTLLNHSNYHVLTLYDDDGIKRKIRVHRAVMCTFTDNTDFTLEVDHILEDKDDNSFESLRWVASDYNKWLHNHSLT